MQWALTKQPSGTQDRRRASQMWTTETSTQQDRDHVDHGGLVGAGQVGEDPDGQGLDAGAGGEGGDDDLVEGEGEGEQAAGEQGRAEGGEGDQAEGLDASSRERETRTLQRGRRAS